MKRYPHILPPDVPVWERYLARGGDRHELIEYDVRVGLGRDPGPEFPENMRAMALDLSFRRIDAVAHDSHRITVIEITRYAGLTAIGQVMIYPILYRLTFMPSLPIVALLVAEEFESDIQVTADQMGVAYVLV